MRNKQDAYDPDDWQKTFQESNRTTMLKSKFKIEENMAEFGRI